MPTIWTKERDNLMLRYYPSGDLDELAERVGTSVMAVRKRARALGIRRKVNLRRPWTERQLSYLRCLYPDATMETLVLLTGHPRSSVEQMALRLKLRKSEAFMQTPRPYSRRAKEIIRK